MPILAVAIGIYLPFELSVPIFAGGIINYLVKSYQSKKKLSSQHSEDGQRKGLLLASGLITGEALVGILLAVPIVITGRPDVLAIMDNPLGPWLGIFLLIGIGYWLYRISTAKMNND